ncbi:MAG: hypothetical protein RL376_466 [Verrucomicrobiota bacterium]
MAKKPTPTAALTFRDLVLGADADTLRQALEARVRIDELVSERQAAYERIAALETQIEEVIGEPGVFPFPVPPLPVAGLDAKAEALIRPAIPLVRRMGQRDNFAPATPETGTAPATPAPAREPAADESDA